MGNVLFAGMQPAHSHFIHGTAQRNPKNPFRLTVLAFFGFAQAFRPDGITAIPDGKICPPDGFKGRLKLGRMEADIVRNLITDKRPGLNCGLARVYSGYLGDFFSYDGFRNLGIRLRTQIKLIFSAHFFAQSKLFFKFEKHFGGNVKIVRAIVLNVFGFVFSQYRPFGERQVLHSPGMQPSAIGFKRSRQRRDFDKVNVIYIRNF